jgi:hypothetical protein
MDLEDTNTRQQKFMYCSNYDGYPHDDKIITKESTDEDNSDLHPQPNHKRQLSCDDEDELYVPAPKKSKASDADHRIAIIIPIMAKRLEYNINTYICWRRNGFDIVLVYNKDEEEAITNILHQHAPDMMTSSIMHPYTTSSPPNAGIAKYNAYRILQLYLDRPDFQFALLLDDTVNDIVNTCTAKSIMTTPTEFYHAVETYALKSPIFGGTVAYKRHPKKVQAKRICNS